MPEIQDFTGLALLAAVLVMGERWLNKLVSHLTAHLERQAEALEACREILLDIQDSFQNPDNF